MILHRPFTQVQTASDLLRALALMHRHHIDHPSLVSRRLQRLLLKPHHIGHLYLDVRILCRHRGVRKEILLRPDAAGMTPVPVHDKTMSYRIDIPADCLLRKNTARSQKTLECILYDILHIGRRSYTPCHITADRAIHGTVCLRDYLALTGYPDSVVSVQCGVVISLHLQNYINKVYGEVSFCNRLGDILSQRIFGWG